MPKKNFISVKRGLSQDPKHRERMGNRIWLFLHLLDRTDWETGIVNDWRDKDEADDMGMAWRTLQKQRQELEEEGYISCHKKGGCQNITIYNWNNPRNYSGEVMNPKSTQKSVLESTQKSVLEAAKCTQRSTSDLGTPSIDSQITDHISHIPRKRGNEHLALSQLFVDETGIQWLDPKSKKDWRKVEDIWNKPLDEMLKRTNGQSDAILKEAIHKMRRDGLTIYSPGSVLKVFVSLCGQRSIQAQDTAHAPKVYR